MQLLRPMLLQSMLNESQFKAVHVNGKDNIRCDALSRLQLARFHRNFPEADKNPTTIPAMFRQLLSEIELSKFWNHLCQQTRQRRIRWRWTLLKRSEFGMVM